MGGSGRFLWLQSPNASMVASVGIRHGSVVSLVAWASTPFVALYSHEE